MKDLAEKCLAILNSTDWVPLRNLRSENPDLEVEQLRQLCRVIVGRERAKVEASKTT